MGRSQFPVTLISSAKKSNDLYPENTVANWTTVIFNELELDGNMEMALTDVSLPKSCYNIAEGEHYLEMRIDKIDSETGFLVAIHDSYNLPPGNYTSIKQVLGYLNDISFISEFV